MSLPTLELEKQLLTKYEIVIGVDEVGRGSLAGPVAVGAFALVRDRLDGMPNGLKDSKLVPEPKRKPLADQVNAWGKTSIGFGSVQMIEQKGINFALRHAALEALASFPLQGNVVLLDGSQNWIGEIEADVKVRVKADRDCGSVSAAAITAKVARDELMISLSQEFPEYQWESNKGYSSAVHMATLKSIGPSEHHRTSWLRNILEDHPHLF